MLHNHSISVVLLANEREREKRDLPPNLHQLHASILFSQLRDEKTAEEEEEVVTK